ncbi:RsiV family protein [Dysosmobacter sp.]|uniref:RsiV family protein n=1 Tax=Dysosmobacter sp. TaxID=2591382 RepID=UPI002A893588|nr:RsiV family protein [Dysosmobacter sp.]MDY3986102.1 RsiV family protein [Dysosmobacter sp.]
MDDFRAFDEKLKERARTEPFPLPENYAGRVFRTCAGLEETAPKRRRPYRWAAWAAAVLALFITVPNVSPAAAAAMADVPVLGTIVRVVTFRDYTYDDGWHSADISVAELAGGDAAQEVDSQTRAWTDQLLGQFQADCEAMGESYGSLSVTSSVVTDSDTWFTLRVDAEEVRASGYQFSRFYHIDKTTGRAVTLKELFREDGDYVTALSDEVRRQMEERMAEDAEVSYFPEEFTAIDPEQNFFFDEDGRLVLVFDEYTVAPGSMGMPEFTIPTDVYTGLLK